MKSWCDEQHGDNKRHCDVKTIEELGDGRRVRSKKSIGERNNSSFNFSLSLSVFFSLSLTFSLYLCLSFFRSQTYMILSYKIQSSLSLSLSLSFKPIVIHSLSLFFECIYFFFHSSFILSLYNTEAYMIHTHSLCLSLNILRNHT